MACKKVCHPTKKIALKTMDAITDRPGKVGQKRPIGVYFCVEHRAWHLTSKPSLRGRR